MLGVPKGDEEWVKNMFDEIMTENFPKWKKETDFQVGKSKRVPNRINSKISTRRHTTIEMAKVREFLRLQKRTKGYIQRSPCKGYQLIFLQLFCRTERSGIIFKELKGKKNLKPRTL